MPRTEREMMAHALEMEPELLPFAPELLADLEELGSDADLIVGVLADLGVGQDAFVVDLGCGKGAVARRIAGELGCRVLGVDLHDGLVADARTAAERGGLADRCRFLVGDVVALAGTLEPADAAVYAALGDTLGPLDDTIGIIRRYVRLGGHLLVNDSYLTDPDVARVDGFENYGSLEGTRAWLTAHGDRLVREVFEDDDTDDGATADPEGDEPAEIELIEARALALAERRPELSAQLRRFVDSQREEYAFLNDAMAGAVWALQRSVPHQA